MPDPVQPPPEPSDVALLARAQRGDESAFAALYHRHRDRCVRIAWRFTGDEAAAWDATHDAFAWLLHRLPTLRLDGRLTTLLYPVLKNVATTAARKRATHDRHAPALAHARPRPELPHTGGDLVPPLQAALDTLPDAQREALLMRAIDGMSTEEIALALGIPAGTVKSRLHHALQALRADSKLADLFRD